MRKAMSLKYSFTVLERNFIPTCTVDVKGFIVAANAPFYKLLSIRDRRRNRYEFNIFNYLPFTESGLTAYIQDCLHTGKAKNGHCQLIMEGGKQFQIEYLLTPVKDAITGVTGCTILLHNIFSEELISEKIFKSESVLRKMWECSVDGMRLTDKTGKILMVNDALCSMIEIPRSQLEGRDITAMHPGNSLELKHILRRYRENFAMGNFSQCREYCLKLFSGRNIYVEVSDSLIALPQGDTCLLSLFRDITKKKRLEEELKHQCEELKAANAYRDRFLSLIAHDLKSPFQSILGYSSIISEEFEELEDTELQELVTKLHSLNKNVYRLVNNLLDWSRLQTGKIPFKPGPLNLEQVVQEIFRLLQPIAQGKGLSLKSKVKSSLKVYADEKMLTSILENLISNALKFTPERGKVYVTAIIEGHRVRVSVTDTGVGINKEDLSRLFMLDRHYTSLGTNNEKGTGLGLLLVKEMIEQHGGTITVESTPGKGSTFSFTIPLNW